MMLAFLFRRPKARETASLKAISDASSNLIRIKKRGREVVEVASGLRTARERNHFYEQIVTLHKAG